MELQITALESATIDVRLAARDLAEYAHAAYWSQNKAMHYEGLLAEWKRLQEAMPRLLKEYGAEVTVAQEGT